MSSPTLFNIFTQRAPAMIKALPSSLSLVLSIVLTSNVYAQNTVNTIDDVVNDGTQANNRSIEVEKQEQEQEQEQDLKQNTEPNTDRAFKLNYAVIWNGSNLGRIETTINNKLNNFEIASITKAEGMASIWLGGDLIQKCRFETRNNMIFSRDFSSQKKGSNSYTNIVNYDWQNQKITFNDEPAFDMPRGYIVDNCNFHFAAAYTHIDKLKGNAIYVMDGKKQRIRGYVLKSVGNERIETPIGEFETTKIVLQREFDDSKTFTFWINPEQPYFPLKMMDSRKSGKRVRVMLIQSLEQS